MRAGFLSLECVVVSYIEGAKHEFVVRGVA